MSHYFNTFCFFCRGLFPAFVSTATVCWNCSTFRSLCPNIIWSWASQVALVVKSPPANAETEETWVGSLGLEDPPEEGRATHSSILAWRIPRREEHGGLQSIGSQRVRHNWSDWAPTHAKYNIDKFRHLFINISLLVQSAYIFTIYKNTQRGNCVLRI